MTIWKVSKGELVELFVTNIDLRTNYRTLSCVRSGIPGWNQIQTETRVI
jgi:hypothetical protein